MTPLMIPILGISCGLLAIFGGVFVKPWFQYRQRQLEVESARASNTDAARLAQEVLELRQRVQVLERVITDNHGSADLVGEIERLRDR